MSYGIEPEPPRHAAVARPLHKIVAVIMHKLGVDHVVVTAEDMQRLPSDMFVTAQELRDGLHIRFVDRATAEQLMFEHGGKRH